MTAEATMPTTSKWTSWIRSHVLLSALACAAFSLMAAPPADAPPAAAEPAHSTSSTTTASSTSNTTTTVAATPDPDPAPEHEPAAAPVVGLMPEPVPGPVTVPEHEPAAAPVADPPLEPAPAPPATEAPVGPDPGTGDLTTRARAAFVDAVPPQWASLVGSVTVIGGSTSLAWEDGRIQISRFHASGPWWRLRAVVAHEVGHLIAFRHGSQAYFGAPPSGAPLGAGSEEVWGECVAAAFTGAQVHHECGPDAVDWTREWLSVQR